MKTVLIVVNDAGFFISHRLAVALEAKQKGFSVHVSAGGLSEHHKEIMMNHGLVVHELPVTRSGKNIIQELKALLNLIGLFKRINPDLVHLVTPKAIIYGGLAARITKIHAVVAAVSGLGSLFVKEKGGLLDLKRIVLYFYRVSLRHKNVAVIFQNPDDQKLLTGAGVLSDHQCFLIRGSGIDLSEFRSGPEPVGEPVVVMASRLLKEKGVGEFVQAARILRSRGVELKMRLIGNIDPDNPSSVTQDEIERWASEGVVEVLGYRTDIAVQYAAANIVCLPSFYGEGLPKCLVEAAGAGRAVITTDHPGCRDAIEPGRTGLLVPTRSAEAIADAIQYLVDNPNERIAMGKAGRELAERAFGIDRIAKQHIDIYEGLLRSEI